MALRLITTIYGFICVATIVTDAFPINSLNDAAQYLQKYGYLEDYTPGIGTLGIVKNAIKDFQRFAGLSVTGLLNSETITKMLQPRCGLKDKISGSEGSSGYKAQGSKWEQNNLKYHQSSYPERISRHPRIDHDMKTAFKAWSDVTPLSFERVASGSEDINIRFAKRGHGDCCSFDGPGGTLAHAFYPQYGGDAHFDDEEAWTIDKPEGTNVLQVAVHEFGHSLGLDHSSNNQAVMAPFYAGYQPGFKLHTDDIQGIQSIYGQRSDAPPNLCQDASIDAAVRTQDGSTYVFKGNYYWKVLSNGLDSGYPRRISDDFQGLEGNLDAALTWVGGEFDGKTYFFKGGYYWRSTNQQMDGGYPKLISEGWQGIPTYLDSALIWSGNGKPYFFKGDEYWRYDSDGTPPVNEQYPLNINEWQGLPAEIDAAVVWDNNISYFFKGDQYYRYNDATSKVDDGYPQSTASSWFNCQN